MTRAVIIGAAKCGSTSLTAMLDAHPHVAMVPHEVHYFSYDEHFARGPDWYEGLFDPASPVTGENSNTYTMTALWPRGPERFIDHYRGQDVRLIYLLRHPLERMESMWLEKRTHGGDSVHHRFSSAARQNRDWLLDPSRYHAQLQPYRDAFGDDAVLIVLSELLKSQPEVQLRRCFAHLGVDPDIEVASPERLNPSSAKRPETATLSRLRTLPFYQQALRLLPPERRSALKRRFFRRQVQGRPEWDHDTRAWAASELAADARAVLNLAAADPSVWFGDADEL